ncbi:transketolase [Acetobacter indonesiensis NRIC 0313]|uniref:Transketolase n=1 Tax=Acetobacter indonesiensis TaxID=104101 RepID=A0A6N3T6M2_9PROT|nr:transketolase C-terminal domain-containing protein [Acetobacter indonesiensis]GAN64321.1 transketolase [Acetobacter indonesiensis]GBQ52761.1 transketolase [Acetobacter indonesiensis NRIC 0313]GEN03197.1 transketolase [Acetobacter indonesiensis]
MATVLSTDQYFPEEDGGLSAQQISVARMGHAARLLLRAETLLPDTRTVLDLMCLPVTALWCRVLRFDPAAPDWPDRDRFVVPSTTMLPLLRAMLRLTGGKEQMALPLEYGRHPALEVAPGPAGQGVAAAAGMALAEQTLSRRFGRSLVNHRTWVLAQDSDLVTGVAMEAAQLAGRFGLDRLAVLVAPSATADLADFTDSLTRFSGSGWTVRKVDATNLPAITTALAATLRARKPTLIACLPSATATIPADQKTTPEEELTGQWSPTARRGASTRRSWLRRFARHRQRAEFEREHTARQPTLFHEDWQRAWQWRMRTALDTSTQESGLAALHALSDTRPELVCLTASSAYSVPPTVREQAGWRAPPTVPGGQECSIQEHGMAGMLNGLALHGGLLPCCAASMMTVDRMRSAMRMAAFMRQKVLYLLTDDGLALGDSGGAWQPVEQLASLRATPNLAVFRPGSAEETFKCWEAALQWQNGPAVLVLCPRQNTPQRLPAPAYGSAVRGGYVLKQPEKRQVTLIASGPEVAIALEASHHLAQRNINAAVVSIPCWELFAGQPASYRRTVLGNAGLRVGIEAASGFGWERWLGPDGLFVGMDDFGTSAPANALYERFGITAEAICEKVEHHLFASGAARGPSLYAPDQPRTRVRGPLLTRP